MCQLVATVDAVFVADPAGVDALMSPHDRVRLVRADDVAEAGPIEGLHRARSARAVEPDFGDLDRRAVAQLHRHQFGELGGIQVVVVAGRRVAEDLRLVVDRAGEMCLRDGRIAVHVPRREVDAELQPMRLRPIRRPCAPRWHRAPAPRDSGPTCRWRFCSSWSPCPTAPCRRDASR